MCSNMETRLFQRGWKVSLFSSDFFLQTADEAVDWKISKFLDTCLSAATRLVPCVQSAVDHNFHLNCVVVFVLVSVAVSWVPHFVFVLSVKGVKIKPRARWTATTAAEGDNGTSKWTWHAYLIRLRYTHTQTHTCRQTDSVISFSCALSPEKGSRLRACYDFVLPFSWFYCVNMWHIIHD